MNPSGASARMSRGIWCAVLGAVNVGRPPSVRTVTGTGPTFSSSTIRVGVEAVPESSPMGRLRGKVYRYAGVPVVVSYHPAYLLRSPIAKRLAWRDLARVPFVLVAPASA